jgi:hypothetical protein
MKLEITVGPEMFRFTSESEWVCKAHSWFRNARLTDRGKHVCIDAAGRICMKGAEFMRAERDGTYPIIVYLIDEPIPEEQNNETS